MTALAALMAELEARLALILVANGYQTDIGAAVKPTGSYMTEEDAPCIEIYEARPGDDGTVMIQATKVDSGEVTFSAPYMVQAFVKRAGAQTQFDAAQPALEDILRALFSPQHGQLANGQFNRLVSFGRGLAVKGANVVPVLVHGEILVTQDIYQ